MVDDWYTLIESYVMEDDLTDISFTVSFLPNTGNKYFMATCGEHFRLYDFENNQLLQSFENIYSSLCDCGKFIKWSYEEEYWKISEKNKPDQPYAWFISRGTELLDGPDESPTKESSCTLNLLMYPKKEGGEFVLEEVRRFKHESYKSNSYFVKITTNGRYLLAPTNTSAFCAFNLLTGEMTTYVVEHSKIKVRDIIVHPYYSLIFTSSDDGDVKAFTLKEEVNNTKKAK